MIELTPDQARAVEHCGSDVPLVLNPRTQESYFLVPKEVYDAFQLWLGPLKRRWDNPADEELTRTPT